MRQIKQFSYSPVVKIISFYTVFEAVREIGFVFDGESHDSWECVFVLEGRAGITADDKVYTLMPGQLIVHPPCEFHSIWNDGNVDLRIIILSFSTEAFPITAHGIYTFPSTDKLLHILSLLQNVFERKSGIVYAIKDGITPAETQLAVSELEKYMVSLLCQGEEITSPANDKRSILFKRATGVMQNNIAKRISAEQIAVLCDVSVSTLQKLFKRFTGMGVAKYYETLVMERARVMVEEGLRIKEISAKLGYDDQNYFSTAYKRYFGASPTKYGKF